MYMMVSTRCLHVHFFLVLSHVASCCVTCDEERGVPDGGFPAVSQAALCLQVGFDVGLYPFSCDLELAEKMVEEQSVFVLPGKVRVTFRSI